MISHLNIFLFIFCVDLVTPESLWRHKGVALHVNYKSTHRFSTMHASLYSFVQVMHVWQQKSVFRHHFHLLMLFFLFLRPTSSVHFSSTDAGSSSQLSSFAGGEACNWRCLTMNQTTLHATRLADIAPATPSHGPGQQLSPCGNSTSVHNRFIIFTS